MWAVRHGLPRLSDWTDSFPEPMLDVGLWGKHSMSFVMWLVRGVVILIVLAAVAYPVADWVRLPMNDEARAELKKSGKADQFVPLSAGVMHVRVQGPADGPTILLVHGASTGGFAFQEWIAPLTQSGFRVIVPDLFGFGFSDRPDARQDHKFLMTALNELLVKLGANAQVHVVGTSMGGAIVADFAAENPERILSVTFIAPAGLGAVPASNAFIAKLFLSPIIGDWMAKVFGPTILIAGVNQSVGPNVPGLSAWMNNQAKYRGYAEAQLSIFRHYDLEDRLSAYEEIGRSDIPVLAIWGTADQTVPYALSKELLARIPKAKLVPIEGQPHGLPLRAPSVLVPMLQEFLRSHPTINSSVHKD